MLKCNQDVREKIKASGLRLWQVAEEYGMADSNLCRKLRHELSSEEKAKITQVIDELIKERRGKECMK